MPLHNAAAGYAKALAEIANSDEALKLHDYGRRGATMLSATDNHLTGNVTHAVYATAHVNDIPHLLFYAKKALTDKGLSADLVELLPAVNDNMQQIVWTDFDLTQQTRDEIKFAATISSALKKGNK